MSIKDCPAVERSSNRRSGALDETVGLFPGTTPSLPT